MNCANHPEVAATAFCRECGKPMCTDCQRPALGSVFCAEHAPAGAAAPPRPAAGPGFNDSPYTSPMPTAESIQRDIHARVGAPMPAASPIAPPASPYIAQRPVADPSVHPLLALILGFAPGVGAIYNGQYAKGLVHAVIFGLLVSIVSHPRTGSMAPLVGIMIASWVIYQAFEAYHTARKRRYGIAVEEFSSLFDVRHNAGRFPVGAVLLIGLGFLLLLDTTNVISFDMLSRYWPGLLIFFGLYKLYNRLGAADAHRHAAASPVNPPDGGRR
jgi:TM2 domain-containing membrane protein YozV